jgi:hypothetical protein
MLGVVQFSYGYTNSDQIPLEKHQKMFYMDSLSESEIDEIHLILEEFWDVSNENHTSTNTIDCKLQEWLKDELDCDLQ